MHDFARPPAPWSQPSGLWPLLDAWALDPRIAGQFVLDETLPARPAVEVDLPPLPAAVERALSARGITQLYSHQRAAIEAAQRSDVVIATPTASGKSLCYNLPVLSALAESPAARALYLFPTKALARDQESALAGLLADAGLPHGAITYDGDTPGDARRAARERTGVLITNPDMLHTGILPHHASWARFFAQLRFVVIDELHTYRGVFGSHLANVLRRLHRIAEFHGAKPRFLFASATIGNPAEHAARLLGRPVECVRESGAPTARRRVIIYNPPVVNAELGIRGSYVKTAVRLTLALLERDISTIVFGPARNTVEVMLKYLRDGLIKAGRDPSVVEAYRGGYLPETRRRIENGLREGTVRAVVATHALELGIDIGQLDAVVCAAYPGTLAGLWQRFGRAGRRGHDSLALLVTSSAPLDQYLARTPDLLLSAPVEEARIDPNNLEVLLAHLKCGAFELPFEAGEGFGDLGPDSVRDALGFLAGHKVVQPVPGRGGNLVYHWSGDAYPAHAVSLRSVGFDNFVIIDREIDRTIAEMDFRSAHTMLHEQAIYQHEGEQYQVERLDYENKKAFIRKVVPDYYTTALSQQKVNLLHSDETAELYLASNFALMTGLGDVNVVTKVVGFKKIKFHTHENVGYGDVHLPEMCLPTSAFWLTVPGTLVDRVAAPRARVIDALRGLGHAMHLVSVMGLMVDPRDLGQTLVDEGEDGRTAGRIFDPTIYLYDGIAGGVGLAPRLFQEREQVLERAFRLVDGCGCEIGCPSCVGAVTPELPGPALGLDRSHRAILAELRSLFGLSLH